jgi:serine/threonine-protein kinase RsbW
VSRPVRPAPLPVGAAPLDVEVRVPADAEAATTMRTVAADLAARAEATLDAVADLRLAVDECCASLVALARPDTRLTCTFSVDEERITVTASVSTTGPTALPTHTLGWYVLSSLTDDLRVLAEAPGSPGQAHRLALRMSVLRTGNPVR